jgi:type I restriction enzyme S subunit
MSPQLLPSAAVLECFESLVKSLDARLYSLGMASRTLAALRDALLPKLISGELRVKDAEKFIERATG